VVEDVLEDVVWLEVEEVLGVEPQPNYQPDNVKREGHLFLIKEKVYKSRNKYTINILFLFNSVSKISCKVVVFQDLFPSPLCYTFKDTSQCRTRVKLNRVFFPR